jgi:hypothetical protein
MLLIPASTNTLSNIFLAILHKSQAQELRMTAWPSVVSSNMQIFFCKIIMKLLYHIIFVDRSDLMRSFRAGGNVWLIPMT